MITPIALVLAMAAGPITLNGSTANVAGQLVNDGDTMVVNVAEANAPATVYFRAWGSSACGSSVSIQPGEGPGAPEYGMLVTATRQFVLVRRNDPTGCVVTITSSDGSGPATVTF